MKTTRTTGWNGQRGDHWVRHRDRYDRMLEPFGIEVVGAAAVQTGDRVLDVGCGAGATTIMAATSTGFDRVHADAHPSAALLVTAQRAAAHP